MTTSADPQPERDPVADPLVRRVVLAVQHHWPKAAVGATVVFAAATLLDPITAAGAFPPQIAAVVAMFGGDALKAAYQMLQRMRRGEPLDEDAIVTEVKRLIPPGALDELAAGNTDILRQIGRIAVVQQQMRGLLEADYATGRALLLAFEQQGVQLDRVLDEMVTSGEMRGYIDELRAEIAALRDRLRDAPTTPQQRPTAAPHFTGREAPLAELREALQPERIVTVTGIGGMGKTSLAAAVIDDLAARGELARRFPGGVIVCSFYDDNDVERAAAHIARSCGLEPLPHPLDMAGVALGARVALLVLDGAEAADNLPKLLDRRGRSGVLITSRHKRDVHGHEVALHRLSTAEAVALLQGVGGERADDATAEAVALLQGVGGERADDATAAAAVCELVGNLPLAVSLAGHYLLESGTGAAEYEAWLRRAGLEALDFGHRRRDSVPVLLDKSLAHLPDAAREVVAVLGALALAPVGVEPPAAALERDADALRRPLAALTAYDLLRRDGDGGYRLSHPLLHEYARERLTVEPAALARLAEYYNQFARVHREEGPPGYRLLDAQRAHIMALLPRLQAAALWAELNALVWAVQSYMDVAGHAFDQLEALGYGVAAAQALGKTYDEASHCLHQGLAYTNLGRMQEAIKQYERALALSRQIQNRTSEGNCLGSLGLAYHSLGRVEEAIGFYEQALAIHRAIGDRRNEGNWLGNLGLAYADLGRVEEAIDFYEQALAISREIDPRSGEVDRRAEGSILGSLGLAYHSLGRVEEAIGFTEQALAIRRAIGDRRGEGNDLGNLGNAYADLGRVEEAIGFYEQALAIHRAIGDRRGEGNDLGNLGSAYYSLGRVEEAIGFYEQALAIHRAIGDRRGEGNDLGNLGSAYYSLGRVEEAIGFTEQALAIRRAIGDRRGEGAALGNLGLDYYYLGRSQTAIGLHEQALAISRAIGDRRGEGSHLANMGLAYKQIGDVNIAIGLVEEALAIFESIKAPTAETVRGWLAEWRGEARTDA
jgi:tetratricopeptide (TPR) repeat protein